MDVAPEITPATVDDRSEVLALLRSCELPTEGLEPWWETMLVAHVDGRVVGRAALELRGGDAILRSVAVDARLRGHGLGESLVRRAVALAQEHRVRDLYLLTETAGGFFPRFGFVPTPRSGAPASIQESIEYRSICPESAESLVLHLRESV